MTRQTNHMLLVLFIVLIVVVPAVASNAADGPSETPLGFEKRLAAFELIEDVYWEHRLWPEANSAPKPRRDEIMSHAQVAAKVERSVMLEAALEYVWGERLTSERIQIELNRIVKNTRHPALLNNVFSALDHDPFLIAECYVRPRLVERLVSGRYAWDREIHRELRDRVATELAGARNVGDIQDSTAVVSDVTLILADDVGLDAVPASAELRLPPDEWQSMIQNLAGRFQTDLPQGPGAPVPSDPGELLARQAGQGVSPFFETNGVFVVVEILEAADGRLRVASATWAKAPFSSWFAEIEQDLRPAAPKGGSYALPKLATGDPCLDDTWAPTAGSGPPSPRSIDSLIWTGTEMIVWGGHDGSSGLSTGGRYDPATDSWLPTSTYGAPSARWAHMMAWSGTEIIVWGGYTGSSALGDGGRYDPATDSWTAVSATGAPAARWASPTVWTGSKMIVWGGFDGSVYFNTGGIYDPSTDSWTATSTTNAPSARYLGAVVWTGDEMIVWGGYNGSSSFGDGGRYDPVADSWTATASSGAPTARYYTKGVWTGDEMIVWGGHTGSSVLNSGGRYDPSTDSWTATTTTAAPSTRYTFTLAWSGDEMIVWGGYTGSAVLGNGGRYDPVADSWTAITMSGAPTSRRNMAAVWTGDEVIVWGGSNSNGTVTYDTGGRYDPDSDSWNATAAEGALTERQSHTAVWTGAEMIVWGGYSSVQAGYLNGGGRYDPASDSWSATTTIGAPTIRSAHAAVWSGTEMIIWGGYGGSNLNTGGRYDPVTDEWTATATSGAPAGRYNVAGVWTGTEMIVWGGWNSSVSLNSGGRYNPDTDTWEATSASGSPSARYAHTTVWTGMEMIVWGGLAGTITNTGGRYDPVSDSWTATTTSGAPSSRWAATATWTGIEMAVWGGNNGTSDVDTGGRYNPVTDGWVAITTDDAPAARRNHKGIWTGSEMILWGGRLSSGDLSVEGGRYDPAMDSWKATSNTAAPSGRQNHQVTWAGSEMIVWGGNDGYVSLDSGGRYCASGVLGIDFGDAPDPTYPTLSASDGARHPFDGVLFLGATVDGESDGNPTASADGDDLDGSDDEDGVTFTSALRLGLNATLDVTASSAGLLSAWIDFNADGDWDDPGEQVFTDTALVTGINNLQLTVPLDAALGTTFARFRCDSVGGLSPTGLAADGEVEDYALTLEPSAELAVSISDGPDPVVQGGRLSYFVTVTNNGGLEATGVTLTDTLDAEISFVSASLPACSETGGVVTCALDSLSAGGSANVEIEVDVNPVFTGTISNSATVVLNEDDPVPANNSDTENTTVAATADYIFADGFETGDADRWSAALP
jgi:uncharacterized repeat protein (TIGR01451 family)